MADITQEMLDELVTRAQGARERAYAPYSRFKVGAAVLAESGRIYEGANVENASYPAGMCAERNAIGAAVCGGERRLVALAVCGGPEGEPAGYCPPCGICRQAMREFCDPADFRVIEARAPGDYRVHTLDALLPESFGPQSLRSATA